ncbi:hypothetical protein NEHOM01_0230 [Nematocida homosporus]|uniref:uncharacterized protein n=1 Tax=Nematocida homosporus TaxID=1912981 RepID=UPI00221FBB13|nr:uncharacterized protein NEHOM01_0230 [Nematocida homosporus]KAI5184555.1 hypothetical protein NEHOM01_0230 [Nematocida homosporus]
MKQSDLIEIEAKVAQLLKEERSKESQRKVLLTEIQASIQDRKSLLGRLEAEKSERVDKVKLKMDAITRAKVVVTDKENQEREKKKAELRKQYEQTIVGVNTIELVLAQNMKMTVDKIMVMKKEAELSGFQNLASAIKEYLIERLGEFVLEVKSLVGELRVDKIIGLVKGLARSLGVVETVYDDLESRRGFWLDIYFTKLYEQFGHHFLGEFQTNRLDKPEWYLEYLLNSLTDHEKVFTILAQVDEMEGHEEVVDLEREESGSESESDGNGLSRARTFYFLGLIERMIRKIVYEKFLETVFSSSRQRRQLILHHAEEVGRFYQVLKTQYGYTEQLTLQAAELGRLMDLFIGEAETELGRILTKNHTEWSDSLRHLLKKVFSESVALHWVVPNVHNILISAVVRKYLSGVGVFLNAFSYHKPEEEAILLLFLEEVVYLEEELLDMENDLGEANGEVTVLEVSFVAEFKEVFKSLFNSLIGDKVEGCIRPLARYRFFEENEAEEIVADLGVVVRDLLAPIENEAILAEVKETIQERLDEYLVSYMIFDNISDLSDLDKIKNILSDILDLLKEHGIGTSLPKSWQKCQEITDEIAEEE